MLRKAPIKKQIKVGEFSNNYNNNKINEGWVLNFDCSTGRNFREKSPINWNPGLCFIPANNILLLPSYSTARTASNPWSWTLLYRQALITPYSCSAVGSRTKSSGTFWSTRALYLLSNSFHIIPWRLLPGIRSFGLHTIIYSSSLFLTICSLNFHILEISKLNMLCAQEKLKEFCVLHAFNA